VSLFKNLTHRLSVVTVRPGAYYYQTPEKGMNFEQTLLNVDKYAKDNNLPYR